MVKKTAMILCGLTAAVVLVCPAPAQQAHEGIEAITKPSQDVTLSFLRPGRVDKVLVKEGQAVKAGDVMIELDDRAERIEMEQLKAQAEDTTRVEAADAQLAQKKVDFAKIQQAFRNGGATELEVQHASLDVTISELSLKLAKFEHSQAGMKQQEAEAQLERMRLKAPFDGSVEKVFLQPGESADGQAKVVRLVKIDPLLMDVPVPLDRVRADFEAGRPAIIEFPGAAGAETLEGTVVHVGAVADAASDTLNVRVEASNGRGRPAGERIRVSFPPAGGAIKGESNKEQ